MRVALGPKAERGLKQADCNWYERPARHTWNPEFLEALFILGYNMQFKMCAVSLIRYKRSKRVAKKLNI
jgi:hypothetical protein